MTKEIHDHRPVVAFSCTRCDAPAMWGRDIEQHLREQHGVTVPFGSDYRIALVYVEEIGAAACETRSEPR